MTVLTQWFPGFEPTAQPRPRVFCFPAAGGNTSVFYSWRTRFRDQIEVLPVELPGHRGRLGESPHSSAQSLAEAALPVISTLLDPAFILVGTSMGALIAFETARRLQALGHEPSHLIVASCPSPRVRRERTSHRLSDDQFLQRLQAMHTTPPEVLASEELLQLLLPAWRADFEMVETYAYRPAALLDVPLTVVTACGDPYLQDEGGRDWRLETTGAVEFIDVDGGHFFFLDPSSTTLPSLIEKRLHATDAGRS